MPTNYGTGNVELYVADNSGNRHFLDRKVKTSGYSTNNFSVGGSASTIFSVDEALVDYGTSNIHVQGLGNNFIDTPSTTSAVTYKLQVSSHNGGAVAVNNNGRTDLIVMEIAS